MTRSQAEPTKLDRLFAAKAILKEAEANVKALETECKGELLDRYLEDGTDRLRSPYFGKDAGYLGISEGKAKEATVREFVSDAQKVIDWMDETRPETDGLAQDNLELFCSWWFAQTGEDIPGFERIEYAPEPGRPIAKLVVKEKVVIPIMRDSGMLEGSAAFLLGDGE